MSDKSTDPTHGCRARMSGGPMISRAAFLRLSLAAGLAAAAPRGADAAEPLRTRPIPSSGEQLPVIGLGTWQTFDIDDDPELRAQRREVLRLLFEGGGRVVDSSPMYGAAESVVGDLLAEMDARDHAFLATKVWIEGRTRGIEQMERSRKKFRSATVDLMQVHNLVDWRTHLPTLREEKEKGRFRYIGLTHYTTAALDELAEIIAQESVDFVQLAYSIGVRAAERRLLPLAAERGVAVLVNRPYEGGSLFRRIKNRPLPDWASEIDCATWGQFFLKFILSHPAVTCIIPGTAKPKHLLDNLGAGRGRLPDAAQRDRMVAHIKDL